MGSELIDLIVSGEDSVRNRSFDQLCRTKSFDELLAESEQLEVFRGRSENLYERVRALFFLYALHRFHLPQKLSASSKTTGYGARSLIPFEGYEHLLHRRFEEAIEHFIGVQ